MTDAGRAKMPDLQAELDYFSMNPFNLTTRMQIDDLLDLRSFAGRSRVKPKP